MGFCLSLCGFALFFLSDYNDWRPGRKGLKFCFPLGALLLVLGTVLEARQEHPWYTGGCGACFSRLAGFFWPWRSIRCFLPCRWRRPMQALVKNVRPAPQGYTPCAAIRGSCGLRDCMGALPWLRGCRCGRRQC